MSTPTTASPTSRRHPGRALAAVVGLAATRQRARPGRGALVALGVAAAAATLLAVSGGGAVSADLKVGRALADAAPDDQLLRVGWSGSQLEGGVTTLDAAVSGATAGLTVGPVARSVLLRESNLGGGRAAVVGAADDLARWVTVDSGRMPGPCRPARCEVIQILGAPLDIAGAADARIVRVGTGRLTSVMPFGDLAARRSDAGPFAQTPVLVSGDRVGLANLAGLSFVFRTYRWAGRLPPGLLHPWTLDTLFAREARAAQALAAAAPGSGLATPDRTLTEARDASRGGARRMLIVGGAAAALLLGFALLAAGSLRADHAEEIARLARRGAGRGLRLAFTAAERLWIGLTGAVAGGLVAVLVIVAVAHRAGVATGGVLRHSVLSTGGIGLVAAIWLGTSALLVAAQALAGPGDRQGAGRAADAIALACLVAVALAAARGGASAADLAAGRDDPLLPALPLLLSLAAALLVARAFGPLARAAERRARTGPLRLRLALLALARRPGRAALTAAFLVVGVGLAVFAESYRATLDRGQRDQAAFAVPADARITGGQAGRLADVLAATHLPDGVAAAGILRSGVAVTGIGAIPAEGTLLGVPADAIGGLPGWRGDFARTEAGTLGRELRPSGPSGPGGVPLPPDLAAVKLPARRTGEVVDLVLLIRLPSGRTVAAPLRETGAAYRGPIPAAARGGRLVGLSAELTPEQQINFGHATGEGRGGDIVTGTLRLGALRPAGGGPVLTDWRGWVGRGGMRAATAGGAAVVRYAVDTDSRALIRPPQPFDGSPLPLAVSADLGAGARRGSQLTIRLAGGASVTGTVVDVLTRFPTLPDGRFVLADRDQLTARLDADDPGAGVIDEAWLSAAGAGGRRALDATLASPAFAPFTIARRDVLERRLRSDPLSRGMLLTLTGAALAALALGVVAVLLAVLSDLRDERRELADLETQGVAPATIRGQLRVRGAITMAVAVLGGLVLGVALSLLVVRLVLVSAGAANPVPPLVRAGGWERVGIGLAGYAVLGAAALGIATRAALGRRGDTRPA